MRNSKQSSRSSWLSMLAPLPSIGAALLPAVTCPACWPAYAGLLSSLGVGFIDYSPWLMPITLVFLVIAMAVLAWQGHQRQAYGPLVIGLIGSTTLFFGKFYFGNNLALYVGVALIISALVWNAWPGTICSTTLQKQEAH